MQNVEKTDSITFRVTHEENLVLRQAAASSRMSVSDYIRAIAVPWAKSDIEQGKPAQASEPPPERRDPSPVTAVARAHGMTRDEYRRFAADILAKAELERMQQSELPPPHRAIKSSAPPAPSGFFQRRAG